MKVRPLSTTQDNSHHIKYRQGTSNSKRETIIKEFQMSEESIVTEDFHEVELNYEQEVYPNIIRITKPFRVRWDIMIMILAVYNTITLPVVVGFRPSSTMAFLVVNVIVDFIFLTDIVMNFYTSYINSDGDEITDRRKIIVNYLKGYFFIDFCAAFPIDNFIVMLVDNSEGATDALLSDLLKLSRIFRLSRILRFSRLTDTVKSFYRLLQLFMYLLLWIHFVACIWFLVVRNQNNWVPVPDFLTITTEFYDEGFWKRYAVCFYHSVWLLLGNELGPRDTLEAGVAAIFLVIGALMTRFIFGEITVLMTNLSRRQDEYQEKLNVALTTMHHLNLPKELTDKILDYISSTQGLVSAQAEYETFQNYISPSLLQQVRACIYDPIISKNPIFHNEPKLTQLLTHSLKNRFTKPEEEIITAGNEADNLYFLVSGECEVFVTDKNKERVRVCYMNPGAHFGEIGLLYGTLRTATVMSGNYCTVAELSKEDYITLVAQFPQLAQKLRDCTDVYQDPWREFLCEVLMQAFFYSYMTENLFREITYQMDVIKLEKGQYLFKPGESADRIYIVADGELELSFTINDVHLHLLKKEARIEGIEKSPKVKKDQYELRKYRDYKLSIYALDNLKPRAECIPIVGDHGVSGCISMDEDSSHLATIGAYPQEFVLETITQGYLLNSKIGILRETHQMQCKAVTSSTVYGLRVEKIESMYKENIDLKKEVVVMKNATDQKLRGLSQMKAQPTPVDLQPLQDNPRATVRRRWWTAVTRVILLLRAERRKGASLIASMVSKLKAIIACEEAENYDLAEKVIRGEIPPQNISEKGTLITDVGTMKLDSILPKNHPVIKAFSDIMKDLLDTDGAFVHNYDSLNSSIDTQLATLESYEQKLDRLNNMLEFLYQKIANRQFSENLPVCLPVPVPMVQLSSSRDITMNSDSSSDQESSQMVPSSIDLAQPLVSRREDKEATLPRNAPSIKPKSDLLSLIKSLKK